MLAECGSSSEGGGGPPNGRAPLRRNDGTGPPRAPLPPLPTPHFGAMPAGLSAQPTPLLAGPPAAWDTPASAPLPSAVTAGGLFEDLLPTDGCVPARAAVAAT